MQSGLTIYNNSQSMNPYPAFRGTKSIKDISKLNQDLTKRIRMHTVKLEKKIRGRNMMAIFNRNPK